MKEGSTVPRRGNVPKREILPDPIYGSVLVTKLVNSIMLDGKKGVAQKVVYGAFQIVERRPASLVLRLSRPPWKISCRPWKSRPAVSAVRTIRFLLKFGPKDVRPLVCAG